jgi:hypothetical protein
MTQRPGRRASIGQRVAVAMAGAGLRSQGLVDRYLTRRWTRWLAGYLATVGTVWLATYPIEGDWAVSLPAAIVLAAIALGISAYVGRRVEEHPIRMSAERTPEWDWVVRHTLERDRLHPSLQARLRDPDADAPQPRE